MMHEPILLSQPHETLTHLLLYYTASILTASDERRVTNDWVILLLESLVPPEYWLHPLSSPFITKLKPLPTCLASRVEEVNSSGVFVVANSHDIDDQTSANNSTYLNLVKPLLSYFVRPCKTRWFKQCCFSLHTDSREMIEGVQIIPTISTSWNSL